MTVVRHERRAAASPPEVWSLLADFGSIATWADDVDHSCLMTARDAGIGCTRRIQTGTTVLLEEVVEWEPERTLAYELRGLPPVVERVVNRWSLTADGDGTLVGLAAEVTPGARVPARAVARGLERRIGAVNAGLVRDLVGRIDPPRDGTAPVEEMTGRA